MSHGERPHPDSARIAELVRGVLALAEPWEGTGFRTCAPRWATPEHLFSGEGARRTGGRWNPPGMLAVYASDVPEHSLAEALASSRRAGIRDERLLPQVNGWGAIRLQVLLDLTDVRVRDEIGWTRRRMLALDWASASSRGEETATQAFGRIAAESGIEGLRVPSAAVARASALVLFPDRLRRGSFLLPYRTAPRRR